MSDNISSEVITVFEKRTEKASERKEKYRKLCKEHLDETNPRVKRNEILIKLLKASAVAIAIYVIFF